MYDNLVLEGGGTRAMVYIGAMEILEQTNILPNVQRLAGSSAGSLFAACICLGYSSSELQAVMIQHLPVVDTPNLLDIILRVAKTKGVIPIAVLRDFVRSVISHKTHPDVTLRQVYEQTGKDLVIVTTDLNRKDFVYFYYKQYPDTKLLDALICSMAIPIFFTPPVLSPTTYFGDPGLFANNYPIWIFNDLRNLETGTFVRSSEVSVRTLGIKIQSSEESCATPLPSIIHNLGDYVYALFKTMGRLNDRMESSPSINRQSICIICDNHPLVVPSTSEITRMVQQGRDAARLYLENSGNFSLVSMESNPDRSNQ